MVSPSKPNHSKVASKSTSYNNCKLVKGLKPLVNFKFYLDIENYNTSNKIENKIKELGGCIDFFLAKEVTHFVTDKQITTDSYSSSTVQSPATPQTPQTSISFDVSAISSPTHESKGNNLQKPKSRADAMLQRVRQQNQDNRKPTNIQYKKNPQSPVQIAKHYGTPIWTAEYTLRFLEKVLNDTKQFSKDHHHHHKKPNNAKILKGNFIKVESLNSKQYRPIYREFKVWPKIHLAIAYNSSPFDSETNKEMTRKNNRNPAKPNPHVRLTKSIAATGNTNLDKKEDHSDKQCGYCEICRVEYDVLKVHLKSDEHMNFVKNDDNFISLDSLIKNSSNVEKFLNIRKDSCHVLITRTSLTRSQVRENEVKLELSKKNTRKNNESYKPEKTNGVLEIDSDDDSDAPPKTRRRISRTNNSSNNKSPKKRKSTGDNDSNHIIATDILIEDETRRSRRESCRRINYAEPKEDEENSEGAIITISASNNTIKKPRTIRWRAPSPEERPPARPPIMYKVEKNNKAAVIKSEPLLEKNKVNNKSAAGKLKIKIRRVRQSELSLLSDEAENFMFPKKELSESDDTDDDRHTTSDPAEISNELVSSEIEIKSSEKDKLKCLAQSSKSKSKAKPQNTEQQPINNDASLSKHETETNPDRYNSAESRRKRRNQLEAFLTDNTDYYKFENPNSRLRFQEAPTQPKLKDDNVVSINKSEDRVGEINSIEITTDFRYSFERVPINEPWYSAFQRQDEGKEKFFEYYGSTAYRKLPFEMGPLPPLPMNCCFLNFMKDNQKCSQSATPLTAPATPVAGAESPMLFNSNDLDEDMVDDATTSKSNSITTSVNVVSRGRGRPPGMSKKKLAQLALLEANHPRKSPREHASTLAILSSIIQNPRQRNKGSISSSNFEFNGDIEENSVDLAMSPLVEEENSNFDVENRSNPAVDYKETLKQLMERKPKYTTSQSRLREIDNFFKVAYNHNEVDLPNYCSSTTDVCDIMDPENKIFVDIIESSTPDDVLLESVCAAVTTNEINERILTKKQNYKLSKSECLHLARSARKRYKKNNRTGWPTNKRRVPVNAIKREKDDEINNVNSIDLDDNRPISELSTRLLNSNDDVSKSPKFNSNKNGINNIKNSKNSRNQYKSLFINSNDKINSDMFTVSSDSLDSVSLSIKLEKIDEYDSVSTRSLFISDDSSLDEETLDGNPPSISNNNESMPTIRSEHNNLTSKLFCLDVDSSPVISSNNNLKIESNITNGLISKSNCSSNIYNNKFNNSISNKNDNSKLIKNDDDNDSKDSKSYGLRSNKKSDKLSFKKIKSQTIHKAVTPPSPQFSPRKLRKPRGRWYRER